MSTQLKGIKGDAYFEFFAGRDPDGHIEMTSIHEISIQFGTCAADRITVELDRFKDPLGQSVTDVILKQWDRIEAMLADQNKEELRKAEEDRAEDEYWRRRLG